MCCVSPTLFETQNEAEITQPRFAKTILTGNLYEKKLYELIFVPLANTIPE